MSLLARIYGIPKKLEPEPEATMYWPDIATIRSNFVPHLINVSKARLTRDEKF